MGESGAGMCTLVNKRGQVVIFPSYRVVDFCRRSRPTIHVDNMKELLGLGPLAKSRAGWQHHEVKGYYAPEMVKYIRPVGGKLIVPICSWRVLEFIDEVASKRDDMVGLRYEKNVKSFIMGHKIKGTIRDVYGACASCPAGWERVQGISPESHLPCALLPWDEGYIGLEVQQVAVSNHRAVLPPCSPTSTQALRAALPHGCATPRAGAPRQAGS